MPVDKSRKYYTNFYSNKCQSRILPFTVNVFLYMESWKTPRYIFTKEKLLTSWMEKEILSPQKYLKRQKILLSCPDWLTVVCISMNPEEQNGKDLRQLPALAAGGITTLVDMPLNSTPLQPVWKIWMRNWKQRKVNCLSTARILWRIWFLAILNWSLWLMPGTWIQSISYAFRLMIFQMQVWKILKRQHRF